MGLHGYCVGRGVRSCIQCRPGREHGVRSCFPTPTAVTTKGVKSRGLRRDPSQPPKHLSSASHLSSTSLVSGNWASRDRLVNGREMFADHRIPPTSSVLLPFGYTNGPVPLAHSQRPGECIYPKRRRILRGYFASCGAMITHVWWGGRPIERTFVSFELDYALPDFRVPVSGKTRHWHRGWMNRDVACSAGQRAHGRSG